MKRQNLILITLIIILIIGCSKKTLNNVQKDKNPCQELTQNFDNNIDIVTLDKCEEWGEKGLWVGGTIINISKYNNSWYQRYEQTITIKGQNKQGSIVIGSRGPILPYKLNQFYKFNLERKCELIKSSASSGMFFDPDLNALEPLEC